MCDDSSVQATVHGKVKWFDPGKGFGFVVPDAGGKDILLHSNVLRNFGQNSVAEGSSISIFVQKTERGMQAVEVLDVTPAENPEVALQEDADLVKASADGAYVAARVKWFDKTKGFGFANIFGDDADVFIHAEVLRCSGLTELQPGEAVCMKTAEGERGQMATVVAPWDTVLKEK